MYKCETHGCDKQQVVHAGGKTTYECQECDRERVRAFTRGFDKPAATGSQPTVTRTLERCRDFFSQRQLLSEARLLEQDCINALALLRAAEQK